MLQDLPVVRRQRARVSSRRHPEPVRGCRRAANIPMQLSRNRSKSWCAGWPLNRSTSIRSPAWRAPWRFCGRDFKVGRSSRPVGGDLVPRLRSDHGRARSRDAIYITSRACGVGGGVHSTCSALAIEIGLTVSRRPRDPVAISRCRSNSLRQSAASASVAGPDYSAAIVEPTNPALFARARRRRRRPRRARYPTIAALMEDLNPLSGHLYVEALHMTRAAREPTC